MEMNVMISSIATGPTYLTVIICTNLFLLRFLFPAQGGLTLWKTGKMVKKNPCREKSGTLKFCWKSGKNQGN